MTQRAWLGILLVCCVHPALAADGDSKTWIDLLLGLQRDNEPRIDHGSARLLFTYRPGPPAKAATCEVEAEITWSGDDYFMRLRAVDPEGKLFGFPTTGGIQDQFWYRYLYRNGRLHTYTPRGDIVRMIRPGEPIFPPLFQLTPKDLWLRCCPPAGRGGRPWSEMIQRLPAAATGGTQGTIEFQPLDNGRVQHTRRDPDGGVATTILSLELSGYPVSFRYVPAREEYTETTATWTWRKLGDATVLDSVRYVNHQPGDPADSMLEYHLKVHDINLNAPDPNRLTVATFLAEVPRTATVQDDQAGSQKRVDDRPSVDDRALQPLIDSLRREGLLKR